MDNITIDRNTLKALGADTRIAILKQLSKRRMTQAELASELNLSAPSVKEHLERLEQAQLVVQKDEGRKWKYFELTSKGAGIIQPSNAKVWFVLAISFLAFAFSAVQVYPYFFAASQGQSAVQAIQSNSEVRQAAEIAPEAAQSAAVAGAEIQTNNAQQTAQPPELLAQPSTKPPLGEAIMMLASLLIIGACAAMLLKRD